MRARALAIASIVAAATACRGPDSVMHNSESARALPLAIHFEPPAICHVTVADRRFALPTDQDRLLEFLTSLRSRWNRVSLNLGMETPYRCVGHAIWLAQRAGLGVDFPAEPPN